MTVNTEQLVDDPSQHEAEVGHEPERQQLPAARTSILRRALGYVSFGQDSRQSSGELPSDSADQLVYKEIAEHPLLTGLPQSEQAEAYVGTTELYTAAKTYVAPVIAGFADKLLQDAQGKQIVFAGRDGLGAYEASKILQSKFEYASDDPEQLVYAYLTRRIVHGTPTDELKQYIHDVGVKDPDDEVLVADIGMYGSIVSGVRGVLPRAQFQYLVSKTAAIPGYADGTGHEMSSLRSVVGNPAVHFLEDTFSGLYTSPEGLENLNGRMAPIFTDRSFPATESLKREYAVRAITDYASSLNRPPQQPADMAISALDDFLSQPGSYKSYMVPHIRG